MELALPYASVTWEAKNTTSTINLVFISTVLQNRIINCGVAKELDHGSDYYPIATELELTPTYAPKIQRRNWKKMNHEEISTKVQLLYLQEPNSIEEIDQYTTYLISFIQDLIEKIVPYKKLSTWATS